MAIEESTSFLKRPHKNTRHGLTGTTEYTIWVQMKCRCKNKTNPAYMDYGGRGITVCNEWTSSFSAFLDSVGKRPSTEHSIDRINNDLGYYPANVRWATRKQQVCNRRNNVYLTHNGSTKNLRSWANQLGVNIQLLSRRVKRGDLSVEQILSPDPLPNPTVKLTLANVVDVKRLILNGKSNQEIGPQFGVHPTTINDIRKGKSWKTVEVGIVNLEQREFLDAREREGYTAIWVNSLEMLKAKLGEKEEKAHD